MGLEAEENLASLSMGFDGLGILDITDPAALDASGAGSSQGV